MSHALQVLNETAKVGTLDQKLQALCAFGAPTLFRMNYAADRTGWWCKINMHVAAKGTSFEIASEAYCKTPTEAVDQLAQRIADTFNQIAALK